MSALKTFWNQWILNVQMRNAVLGNKKPEKQFWRMPFIPPSDERTKIENRMQADGYKLDVARLAELDEVMKEIASMDAKAIAEVGLGGVEDVRALLLHLAGERTYLVRRMESGAYVDWGKFDQEESIDRILESTGPPSYWSPTEFPNLSAAGYELLREALNKRYRMLWSWKTATVPDPAQDVELLRKMGVDYDPQSGLAMIRPETFVECFNIAYEGHHLFALQLCSVTKPCIDLLMGMLEAVQKTMRGILMTFTGYTPRLDKEWQPSDEIMQVLAAGSVPKLAVKQAMFIQAVDEWLVAYREKKPLHSRGRGKRPGDKTSKDVKSVKPDIASTDDDLMPPQPSGNPDITEDQVTQFDEWLGKMNEYSVSYKATTARVLLSRRHHNEAELQRTKKTLIEQAKNMKTLHEEATARYDTLFRDMFHRQVSGEFTPDERRHWEAIQQARISLNTCYAVIVEQHKKIDSEMRYPEFHASTVENAFQMALEQAQLPYNEGHDWHEVIRAKEVLARYWPRIFATHISDSARRVYQAALDNYSSLKHRTTTRSVASTELIRKAEQTLRFHLSGIHTSIVEILEAGDVPREQQSAMQAVKKRFMHLIKRGSMEQQPTMRDMQYHRVQLLVLLLKWYLIIHRTLGTGASLMPFARNYIQQPPQMANRANAYTESIRNLTERTQYLHDLAACVSNCSLYETTSLNVGDVIPTDGYTPTDFVQALLLGGNFGNRMKIARRERQKVVFREKVSALVQTGSIYEACTTLDDVIRKNAEIKDSMRATYVKMEDEWDTILTRIRATIRIAEANLALPTVTQADKDLYGPKKIEAERQLGINQARRDADLAALKTRQQADYDAGAAQLFNYVQGEVVPEHLEESRNIFFMDAWAQARMDTLFRDKVIIVIEIVRLLGENPRLVNYSILPSTGTHSLKFDKDKCVCLLQVAQQEAPGGVGRARRVMFDNKEIDCSFKVYLSAADDRGGALVAAANHGLALSQLFEQWTGTPVAIQTPPAAAAGASGETTEEKGTPYETLEKAIDAYDSTCTWLSTLNMMCTTNSIKPLGEITTLAATDKLKTVITMLTAKEAEQKELLQRMKQEEVAKLAGSEDTRAKAVHVYITGLGEKSLLHRCMHKYPFFTSVIRNLLSSAIELQLALRQTTDEMTVLLQELTDRLLVLRNYAAALIFTTENGTHVSDTVLDGRCYMCGRKHKTIGWLAAGKCLLYRTFDRARRFLWRPAKWAADNVYSYLAGLICIVNYTSWSPLGKAAFVAGGAATAYALDRWGGDSLYRFLNNNIEKLRKNWVAPALLSAMNYVKTTRIAEWMRKSASFAWGSLPQFVRSATVRVSAVVANTTTAAVAVTGYLAFSSSTAQSSVHPIAVGLAPSTALGPILRATVPFAGVASTAASWWARHAAKERHTVGLRVKNFYYLWQAGMATWRDYKALLPADLLVADAKDLLEFVNSVTTQLDWAPGEREALQTKIEGPVKVLHAIEQRLGLASSLWTTKTITDRLTAEENSELALACLNTAAYPTGDAPGGKFYRMLQVGELKFTSLRNSLTHKLLIHLQFLEEKLPMNGVVEFGSYAVTYLALGVGVAVALDFLYTLYQERQAMSEWDQALSNAMGRAVETFKRNTLLGASAMLCLNKLAPPLASHGILDKIKKGFDRAETAIMAATLPERTMIKAVAHSVKRALKSLGPTRHKAAHAPKIVSMTSQAGTLRSRGTGDDEDEPMQVSFLSRSDKLSSRFMEQVKAFWGGLEKNEPGAEEYYELLWVATLANEELEQASVSEKERRDAQLFLSL